MQREVLISDTTACSVVSLCWWRWPLVIVAGSAGGDAQWSLERCCRGTFVIVLSSSS